MKYVVQASSVTELYEVKKFVKDDGKTFYQKPEFVKTRVDDWQEVLSFECDRLEYNKRTFNPSQMLLLTFEGSVNKFNISPSEEVAIFEQVFRADKATTYLHSDKVLSIKEDKETNQKAYWDALEEYRNYVFEKYPDVKEYCELHCVKDELENIDKIKNSFVKVEVIKDRNDALSALVGSTFYLGRDDIKLFPKN